jgi:peptidoglycan/xylan/chitin deacetylase (PgdA/CDA1 family)
MGTVVLSIDAELAWGFHDLDDPPQHRIGGARDGWRTLLRLCDEYQVPATWAIVGHLMLDDCDGDHATHPAPDGWFDHEWDPDRFPREVRFGDGLVEDVRSAAVDHEVASHTFSHVEFCTLETSEKLARAEATASREAADQRGLDLETFVFPRRKVGHRAVLAAEGFQCYRGRRPTDNRITKGQNPVSKLLRWLALSEPPPLVRPRVDRFGLVNVPASLFLFGLRGTPHKVFDAFGSDPVVAQAVRGIDAAAVDDGIFHMWLHPNDVLTERDRRRVAAIFTHLEGVRSETDLEVATMATVAARHRRLAAPPTPRTN